jgi:hypothetical protein
VDNFLSEYGWRLVEHLGYDELAERYMKPTGRELPSMMIERMVTLRRCKIKIECKNLQPNPNCT